MILVRQEQEIRFDLEKTKYNLFAIEDGESERSTFVFMGLGLIPLLDFVVVIVRYQILGQVKMRQQNSLAH